MTRTLAAGIAGLVLMALPACSRSTGSAEMNAAELAVMQQSNLERLWTAGTSTAGSAADVIAAYGEPSERDVKTAPNRHTEAMDTVITLRYPSRSYVFLRSGANGRSFPALVEVTESNLQLTDAIQLGVTSPAVLDTRLGRAMRERRAGDTLFAVYARPTKTVNEIMELGSVEGRVVVAQWKPYVD